MNAGIRKRVEDMNCYGIHSQPVEVGRRGDVDHGFVTRRYFVTKDGLKVTYSMVRSLLPTGTPANIPLREALTITGLLEDFETGHTVSIVPFSV